MFNKPALFPKTPEPKATPGVRTASKPLGGAPAHPMGASTATTARDSMAASESVEAPKSAEAATQNSGNRLIVGPEVKLKGAEILDCDTLVVEGRVEATMDSRVIRIAENGAFAGKVGIDVAEIHGRFDGELTAREQLIVHATGRVSGKIRYGKIFIEEGGEICGDVQSLSAAQKGGRAPDREADVSRVTATG